METNKDKTKSLVDKVESTIRRPKCVEEVSAIPCELRYGVNVGGHIVCYTREKRDADFIIQSIEAAEKFASVVLECMLSEMGDKPNEPEPTAKEEV